MHELTIAEVAYFGGVAEGAHTLNPLRDHDHAVEGATTSSAHRGGRLYHHQTANEARANRRRQPRVLTPDSIAAGFFAEEVRRESRNGTASRSSTRAASPFAPPSTQKFS